MMSNKTEMLNRSRKRMLIGIAIGFSFWWGSWTIISLFPELRDFSFLITAIIIGLMGWAYWVLNQFRMIRIIAELKQNPKLNQALNDEFYKHIRLKSFRNAFIILILTQAFLVFINMFYALSAENVININIFIGVTSPIISFIIFDHEQSYE